MTEQWQGKGLMFSWKDQTFEVNYLLNNTVDDLKGLRCILIQSNHIERQNKNHHMKVLLNRFDLIVTLAVSSV